MGFGKNEVIKNIEVVKAHKYEKDNQLTIFCDIKVDNVVIYGCRFVTGAKGDFITFPSYKADNGKYYNYAWTSFTSDEVKEIEKQIKKLLNFE